MDHASYSTKCMSYLEECPLLSWQEQVILLRINKYCIQGNILAVTLEITPAQRNMRTNEIKQRKTFRSTTINKKQVIRPP